MTLQVGKYRQVFQSTSFRRFWTSFTFSALGDVMTHVALTWFVYDLTGSAQALGLLALTYTGPVIIGGLVAGPLLDRFNRRKVMIVDNLVRGSVLLLIPVFYALGTLALWHIYLVSAVYGSLMMLSLAGSPALVPDLVDEQHLDTANALETLSYTLSGVIGPPLAGFLIPLVGAPNVVIIDTLSYFLFALILLSIKSDAPAHPAEQAQADSNSYRISDAIRLVLHNNVLLSTTLMFMTANLGLGALFVWLPILSDQVLGGGAELYGLLLGVLAVGEVISSVLAGTLVLPFSLGTAICLGQVLSGIALSLIAVSVTIPTASISLALLGFFSAPLTIWAQTLRMKIIPHHLRGRTFALLRTMMQSANPIGGALGGSLMPLLSIPVMVIISALLIGLPGVIGYNVSALREAGQKEPLPG